MASHRPGGLDERCWGKTDSGLTKSVLASISLHVVIFTLLYQHVRLPAESESVPEMLTHTRITLVPTNLQRQSEQSAQEADESLPVPAPDIPPETPSTDSTPDTAPPPDPETGSSMEEAANEIVEQSEGESVSEPISPATLKDSINNFNTTYRSNLKNQWLENCMRQRNGSVARDCDDSDTVDYTPASEERENIRQFFTDMLPDLYYSPYKRRFEQANAALEPLTERDDLVGELARTRYDLNESNLRYLNRQFTGDTPNTMSMRICNPMPCVFRFSEFEVKKPEGWEEASESRDRFQVTAPLFQAK